MVGPCWGRVHPGRRAPLGLPPPPKGRASPHLLGESQLIAPLWTLTPRPYVTPGGREPQLWCPSTGLPVQPRLGDPLPNGWAKADGNGDDGEGYVPASALHIHGH